MNPSSRGKILLVGAGGHARSCIDVLELAGWDIAGLIGLPQEAGTRVLGYPVVGTEADLPRLLGDAPSALVVIGEIKSPELRIAMFERLGVAGFRRPAVISPLAHVSAHARVGEGSIVMHGAVVNAGAVVGDNCIINSRALIEHDAQVAAHCHISTGSVLNGGVRVGRGSFVGSGAVVRQEIRIGEYCVIGMGSMVREDCADRARIGGRD